MTIRSFGFISDILLLIFRFLAPKNHNRAQNVMRDNRIILLF